jgi:hypothetical protein
MTKSKKIIGLLLIAGMFIAEASSAFAAANLGTGTGEETPRERCLTRCDIKYALHGNFGPSYARCQVLCRKLNPHIS